MALKLPFSNLSIKNRYVSARYIGITHESNGTAFWKTVKGEMVEVTNVWPIESDIGKRFTNPDQDCPKDYICYGEVIEFIRTGKKSAFDEADWG